MRSTTPLLLRCAAQAGGAEPRGRTRYATAFRDRQALAAGESRHAREYARFLLDVEGDAPLAVKFALENWRRPASRKMSACSVRAAVPAIAKPRGIARRWIADNHYEDGTLE